ncbi:ras-related protein Rap-2b-like [Haliotis rufescens]|uniref:ras-related protein Rap-2b-like n=1 Tax=Haliotis rufescens TaxID=6454 RepID=UPI00201F9679|nr:ras-related protein Rap-2b-like [Haliotis rufescens]
MKVVFIGAARAGKTTIILNMLYGICNQKYKATIEDHFNFCAKLPDGKIQVLDIVDKSGTDEFPVMRDLRIRQGEVFVVVYAVDSRESFQYAVRMCQKIKAVKDNERAPIILVGNKTDMSSERSVTYEEGYQFLLSWKTCFFIETSARLGDHIERMLHLLIVRGDPNNERAPIILVGNKTDMSSERSVTYEEGYQFLLSWKTCFFIETSARLGDHIERMLHLLIVRGDPRFLLEVELALAR